MHGAKTYRHKSLTAVLALGLLSTGLGAAGPARAVVPGVNGKIAFTSNRNGAVIDIRKSEDIWVMNADGSGLIRLTTDPASDGRPDWSPDGRRIAFSSNRVGPPGGPSDIWVMNADGSGQTRLTTDPADDSFPSWSPDGGRIAFETDEDIFVMNADGSGQSRLTTDPNSDIFPTWSPDGNRIAFSSDRSQPGTNNFDIWVMHVDGSGLVRLTTDPGGDFAPSWQALPTGGNDTVVTPPPGHGHGHGGDRHCDEIKNKKKRKACRKTQH
jgi:Tol biopolymer transport system component